MLLFVISLLWIAIGSVDGEILRDQFLRDLIATFRLKSPTIVYDTDMPPDICYTDQWVLCLSSVHPPQSNPSVEPVLDTENCFTVSGPDPGKKCILPFNRLGITHKACSNRYSWRPSMYICPTDIGGSTVLENNETAFYDQSVWDRGKWGYRGPECPVEGKHKIHSIKMCEGVLHLIMSSCLKL